MDLLQRKCWLLNYQWYSRPSSRITFTYRTRVPLPWILRSVALGYVYGEARHSSRAAEVVEISTRPGLRLNERGWDQAGQSIRRRDSGSISPAELETESGAGVGGEERAWRSCIKEYKERPDGCSCRMRLIGWLPWSETGWCEWREESRRSNGRE